MSYYHYVENGYTYDIYGEPTVTGSLANEFDFAGQQTDASTDLQYLRARYYDPATGGFLSRDPLASVPSWLGSPFGYGYADPVGLSDPTGLDSPWDGVRKRVNPCNWGGLTGALCGDAGASSETIASVLDASGKTLASLVKLTGELSVAVGEGFWKVLSADPALTEYIFSSVLTGVVGLCVAGVVTAGTTCAVAVAVLGIYAAWKISGLLADDEISDGERFVRTLIKVANSWPGGGLAKALFDAIASALEPRTAE